MKYIIEFIKALIISPEMLLLLLVTFAWWLRPDWFAEVGGKLKADQEIWKYLCFIPSAILVWILVQSNNILFPLPAPANKPLLEWPDYWRLKIRVVVAAFFALLCTIASVFTFIFTKEIYASVAGLIIIMSIAVCVIDAMTIWYASISIRQIMEKNQK